MENDEERQASIAFGGGVMAEDCHLKDASLPLSTEPPISTNLIVGLESRV